MKMKKHSMALALVAGLAGSAGAVAPANVDAPGAQVGYLTAKYAFGGNGLANATIENGAAAAGEELGKVAGRALGGRAAAWIGGKIGAKVGALGGPVGAIVGAMVGAA